MRCKPSLRRARADARDGAAKAAAARACGNESLARHFERRAEADQSRALARIGEIAGVERSSRCSHPPGRTPPRLSEIDRRSRTALTSIAPLTITTIAAIATHPCSGQFYARLCRMARAVVPRCRKHGGIRAANHPLPIFIEQRHTPGSEVAIRGPATRGTACRKPGAVHG
jgi:hypothetical protein